MTGLIPLFESTQQENFHAIFVVPRDKAIPMLGFVHISIQTSDLMPHLRFCTKGWLSMELCNCAMCSFVPVVFASGTKHFFSAWHQPWMPPSKNNKWGWRNVDSPNHSTILQSFIKAATVLHASSDVCDDLMQKILLTQRNDIVRFCLCLPQQLRDMGESRQASWRF